MNEQNRKQIGDIQAHFAKMDWSKCTDMDRDHVTLYCNGVLVWGTEL